MSLASLPDLYLYKNVSCVRPNEMRDDYIIQTGPRVDGKKRFVTKRYRIPEFSEKEAVDRITKSPLLILTWKLRVLWK